jgi:membrane-associated phospholipid phosphatase
MFVGCSQNAKSVSGSTNDIERALEQAQMRPHRQTAAMPTFLQAAHPAARQDGVIVAAVGDPTPAETNPPADEPLSQTPGFGEVLKDDVKHLPQSLWDDTKRVYTDKDNLIAFMIAGGASLAVRNSGVDDTWEDHFDRHRSFSSEWGDVGGAIGNPGVHLALAATAYAYGLKSNDAKTYNVGKTLMDALIINDLSTMLLKVGANTESPNGENLAWPSGHTSSSFCLAAVLDESYGHKVGIPLYLAAAFVGFERMDDREHHFSDVLFGATLGYIVGKTVARDHSPEILGGRIIPYVDPYHGTSGLAWLKSF